MTQNSLGRTVLGWGPEEMAWEELQGILPKVPPPSD